MSLGNCLLRLTKQHTGSFLQKAQPYPTGTQHTAVGKALSVDGTPLQRNGMQAVAGDKGKPCLWDQQVIRLFGGDGAGTGDNMVAARYCFVPQLASLV